MEIWRLDYYYFAYTTENYILNEKKVLGNLYLSTFVHTLLVKKYNISAIFILIITNSSLSNRKQDNEISIKDN